jgi:hypothetical protein
MGNIVMDDLQNVNKLASALSLFIKVPIWISRKKYIEKNTVSTLIERNNETASLFLYFVNRLLQYSILR